jgi:hypothetical protein
LVLLDEYAVLNRPDLTVSLKNCYVLTRNYAVAFVLAVFTTILLRNPDTQYVLLIEVVSLLTALRAIRQVFLDAKAASHLTVLALSRLYLTRS